MQKLVVVLSAAVCTVHIAGRLFAVLVQKNSSNERHDGEETETEYNTRCDYLFRLHRS